MHTRFKLILYFALFWPGIFLIAQHNAELVDYRTEIRLKDGVQTITRSYEIQINDRDSDWLAEIEIPYSEGDEPKLHEALITSISGEVHRKLKKKEIVTRSDISEGSLYEDDYVWAFDLKWNQYPYRVRYSYSVSGTQFLYLAHWFPALARELPIRHASLQLEMPVETRYRVDRSAEITIEDRSDEASTRLFFELSGWRVPKRQHYAPPFYEAMPHVSVMPEEFYYGVKGNSSSWQSFGAWVNELNAGQDVLPATEQERVDELIRGIADDREKVGVLFAYMQERTRYVNVSLDVGGLKSYSASYVSRNGYGDCKALSTYMKALLKHANIPSYYTLVYAGKNPRRINTSFPSQQFNHVILCVPLGKDTIWLENTSQVAPMGYLGTFSQDRYVLLVSEKNSRLVRTPALTPEEMRESSHYIFSLNSIGSGQLNIRYTSRSELRNSIRNYEHAGNSRQVDARIRKEVRIKDFEMAGWKTNEADRSGFLDLRVEGKVGTQFRSIGDRKVLSPFPLVLPDFEEEDERMEPVRLNHPIYKVDTISYHIGALDRYRVGHPEPREFKDSFGFYRFSTHQEGGRLMMIRAFCLNAGEYDLESYPALLVFLERIRKYEKQTSIVLSKKQL